MKMHLNRRSFLSSGLLILAPALAHAQAHLAPEACPPPGPPIPKTPSVKDLGLAPSVANIAYASVSNAQRLDLYRPASGDGPFPVIVYIHGGGFRLGTRTMASAALVTSWLKAGWAVASVDYRLSGEARFPAAVQDVFAAIDFLRRESSSLRIDGNRLVVYGESAGANLAALAGTAWEEPAFWTLSSARAHLKPSAVIALYPPVDFLQIDAMLQAQGCFDPRTAHNNAQSFESRYLGAALADVPDRVALANPARHASAGSPPFFIQNGEQDCNVGAGQGKLLADALQKAGVPVTYEVLAGAAHGGPAFETADNVRKIAHFLRSF